MGKFIGLSVPNLKGNELKYVTKAIETEWVSTAGPYITEFEEKIAEYLNVEEAVACQSGTSGLHLALLACGVQPDERVLVPTLTFVAAVNPVRYAQAEPIFMDCDDTLTMDPIKLRRFCEEECEKRTDGLYEKNSGKRVAAVVVVHVFGNMADMEEIMDIACKYQLKVIEDATEALGTYYTEGKYKGKYAGTIGDIGVYSFNGNKIITTGGGGMIVSNQKEMLQHMRHLSTQAKADNLYFDHDEIGYNYRMGNVQAAIGIAQLEQLETFIDTKQNNYKEYSEKGITLLPFRENIRSNRWFYSYMTSKRDQLLQELQKDNIQTRPIWKLIHTLKPYEGSRSYEIEKALYYYEHVLNIPCSTNLSKEEVAYVADKIRQFEQK